MIASNLSRRRALWVAVLALAATSAAPAAWAQILQRPLVVRNARILTMDRGVLDNGMLLVKGEKIAAIGPQLEAPLLAKKVDAGGGTITPGLIDAWSGLAIGGTTAGPANPTRRAVDAFDRYDTFHLVETLRRGVTAVYVPSKGPAGICGTGAVVRLAPRSNTGQSFGRVLKSEAALCIDLGSTGAPIARLKTLATVRKQFREAVEYRKALEDYEEDLAEYKQKLQEAASKKKQEKKPAEKKPPTASGSAAAEEKPKDAPEEKKEDSAEKDKPKKPTRPGRKPKLDVLLRAVDRRLPVRIVAHRSEDILNALELAEEFSLHVILEGATDAHLVAGRIAAAEISGAKVSVVLGNVARRHVRRDDSFRRALQNNGQVLSAAGVRWFIGSGADHAAGARFVLLNSQLAAAANGNRPLQSVTAEAADLLGVAGQVGRLRPGALADFVLWSGDPLDPATKVLRVYVGGKLVYEAADQAEPGRDP